MGTYNAYTIEQQQFLEHNAPLLSRKDLTELFNITFGTTKSEGAIKSYCNARGWNSANNGRFEVGHRSWQTGLNKEDFRSHYSDESFSRMTQAMIDANKTLKLGDEVRKHDDDYIVISLDYARPFDDRIVHKRRYIWEQANGRIPEGYRVIHLDGDRGNYALDNLACIPSKYIPILNKNRWLNKSKDVSLAAIKWCDLYYAIRDI